MNEKVDIRDFVKLDLRVGEIKEVRDHENASKLFVLKVDLGEKEERTIVAGLKGHYEKEDLIGKKAVFIANLQPINLRGIESNGMILAASDKSKENVRILIIDGDFEVGSKVS